MSCVQREQPISRKESIGPEQPLAFSDSLFRARQHTVCSDFRFHPVSSYTGVSRLFSLFRHCRELAFQTSVDSVFHLPASLRSTPITVLHDYYGRCDSSPGSPPGRGLPDSCTWPSFHSVSNHLCSPKVAFARYPSAPWASSSRKSGLRHYLAGSPHAPAVSSSSTYGLEVHSL